MKIREVMTSPVVRISPEENVAVASRMLTHYNIGALPVCGSDGRLCGMVTDRDIVTRCLAAERSPGKTSVKEIMTQKLNTIRPDMDTETAAALMSSNQIRRLPVMENGKLCGMVSLGDLAVREETVGEAGETLSRVSSQLSRRD